MNKKELDINEIKKIQFDLLIYLHEVCKENNIRYDIFSGTLLGAIKYKGYIPWDDDIDVVLFRDEYMKLIKVLKNNNKYKILSIYNTKDYYYPFAKLVNTDTILIENSKPIKDMGVYIDIFPMDAYDDCDLLKQINKLKFIRNMVVKRFGIKNCIRNQFDYMKENNVKTNKFKKFIYNFIDYLSMPLGYKFWAKLLDKKISKNDVNKAKYVGVRTGEYGLKEVFEKTDLLEQTLYEFEGKKFYGFLNADMYLKKKYGDYHKDPVKSQQRPHHQFKAYWKD